MRQLALTIAISFIFTLSISLLGLTIWNIFNPVQETIIFFDLKDKSVKLEAQIAQTTDQKITGLSKHDWLPFTQSMLFVYDQENPRSMWMKGMSFPIDIIFLDSDKNIINFYENVPPCSSSLCPSYASDFPAQYVIEMNAGLIRTFGITTNTNIDFILP